LNAIYFLPLLLTNNNRKNLGVVAEGKLLPSFRELFAILTTFTLTVFAWIFFRAENISYAFSYILGIFSGDSIFNVPSFNSARLGLLTLCLTIAFIIVEWIGRNSDFAIQNLNSLNNSYYRYTFYSIIVFAILIFGNYNQNEFIYFQF
jgi:alginate O-acetyltransferase complex protein AlgI